MNKSIMIAKILARRGNETVNFYLIKLYSKWMLIPGKYVKKQLHHIAKKLGKMDGI